MIFKTIIYSSISTFLLLGCQGIKKESKNIKEQVNYIPKYKTEWANIDKNIRGNWDTHLTKSPDYNNIYINSFLYAPFMFYWDSYFINHGLIIHDLDVVAKWNTENILSVVEKYGYMGNAAVTDWGMNRSQPPYLSSMVKDIFDYSQDTNFLRKAYPILIKEYKFWTDTSKNAIENHITDIPGLHRFSAHPSRKELLELFSHLASRFDFDTTVSDDQKAKIAFNYAVEAATGMDFTPRFEGRCPDFSALELNCLLFVYEKNFDWMTKLLQIKTDTNWQEFSESRKKLINKYHWNEEKGMYYDYDFVNKRHSKVATVVTFQPLWAGLASDLQAKKVVENMPVFECEFGLKTTEVLNEKKYYQWGEKSVWSPMQHLIGIALDNYGYKNEAKRVAAKYLDLVAKNYIEPQPRTYTQKNGQIDTRRIGKIYEKYTFEGKINDGEYMAAEMMGWSTAAYAWCYDYLQKNK